MRKVFIAVPMLDGKVFYDCHESLIRNSHVLTKNGYEVVPYYHPCHIYIDRARSLCVHEFLKSDCDDLVFIDADVGFEDDSILKLLKHDKDIVAGAYPFRKDHALDFPVVIEFNRQNNCKDEETGLVYAKMVPTGFMRIKRRVFEKMLEEYRNNPGPYYRVIKDHEGVYTFFVTGIVFPNDNTWYGEDTAFSMQWKAMGGAIYIEPNINFTHTGMKQFKGNFHDYLMGRKVNNLIQDNNKTGLPGWMSDGELALLKILAAESEDIVEIGSWKGRSTKALLESCKGKVYAVDHWKGSKNDMSCIAAVGEDIYKEFIENVGHYSNLSVLKGNSVEMAKKFNGSKVDMVFIDAGHSYEECKEDIEAWLPKTKKIICGHDYNWFGVKKAVKEKFDNVNITENIWWVKL